MKKAMKELLKTFDALERSWEAHFLNVIRESQPEGEAKAVAFKIISVVDSDDLLMKTTAVVRYADGKGAYKTWLDKDIGTPGDAFNEIQEWVESLNGSTPAI